MSLLAFAPCASPNRQNSGSPGKEATVFLELTLTMDSISGGWMEGSLKVREHIWSLSPRPRLATAQEESPGPGLQHRLVGTTVWE